MDEMDNFRPSGNCSKLNFVFYLLNPPTYLALFQLSIKYFLWFAI